MPKVSSLTGEVVVNINKWTAGIKQVEKDASALQKSLAPITQIASVAGAALLGIGAAAVGALATATKISADYGDKIRDASVRTGLTTEALSGLKYQAEQTGASFDELNNGLKFLSRNFSEAAASGKGKAAEAFHSLGISVKELRSANGDLEPVLRKVMDRIAALPSASDKVAAGTALMGKGFAQLTETMSGGSEAMDAYRAKADLFGLTIGKETAAAADNFNDALNNLKQASLGLSLTFGNALIPSVTQFVNWVTAAIVTLKDFITEEDRVVERTYKWYDATFPLLASLRHLKEDIGELSLKTIVNKGAVDAITESEKKRTEQLKLQGEKLSEQTELEKKHAETLIKARALITDLQKKYLAEELKAYQQTLKDEETASEHKFKVAVALMKEETDFKLAHLDLIEKALKLSHERAADDEKAMREDLARDLEYYTRRAEEELSHVDDVIEMKLDAVKMRQEERAKALRDAAEDARRVWQTAVGNITSDFARGLSDIIFEGRKFGDAMAGIAKSTAKSMFNAFLSGLLSPLTTKLGELGAKLASVLFGGGGAAGGGNNAFPGTSSSGGLLGGIIGGGGGILGGIFGKGGGAAAGGVGMSLGAAALSGGILTGVPLLAGLLGGIGGGRKAANEIVKSQEALEAAVASTLSDSSLSALNKSKIVDNLFSAYQANSAAFAQGGENNAKVANQSFATLAPWMARVQADLQRQIPASSGVEGGGPQTENNFNIVITLTEGKNARATGALFRDEILPAMIEAIRNNTSGITGAITLGVKNSTLGMVTTNG